MKKILLFSIAFCFSIALNAQLLNFGIKLGAGYSSLPTKFTASGISNFIGKPSYGIHGGLFARINIKGFYLQPEVLVALKKGSFTYDVTQIDPNNPSGTITQGATQTVNLTAVDIPLMLGYRFGKDKINFRIFAGPMVSYALHESIKLTVNGVRMPKDDAFNIKDAIWSIRAGLGIDVWKFTIDACYERSLNNISWTKDVKQATSLINLSLGFKFI